MPEKGAGVFRGKRMESFFSTGWLKTDSGHRDHILAGGHCAVYPAGFVLPCQIRKGGKGRRSQRWRDARTVKTFGFIRSAKHTG